MDKTKKGWSRLEEGMLGSIHSIGGNVYFLERKFYKMKKKNIVWFVANGTNKYNTHISSTPAMEPG